MTKHGMTFLLLCVQVLVEFDDETWQDRKWLRIHDECQYFAVEKTVVWAPTPDDRETDARLETSFGTAHTYVPSLVGDQQTVVY